MRTRGYIVSILLAFLTFVAVNQANAEIVEEYPISVLEQNPCFPNNAVLPIYVINHSQSGEIISSSYRCYVNETQAKDKGVEYKLYKDKPDHTIYRKVSIPSDHSLIPYGQSAWSIDNSNASSTISDCFSSSISPVWIFGNIGNQIGNGTINAKTGNYEIVWPISKNIRSYFTSYNQLRKAKKVKNCYINEAVQGDKLLIEADNQLKTIYEISLPSAKLRHGRIKPFAKTQIYSQTQFTQYGWSNSRFKFDVYIDSQWKQCRFKRKIRISAYNRRLATIRLKRQRTWINMPKRFFSSRTVLLKVMPVNRNGGTCGATKIRLRLKPRIKPPEHGGGAPPQHRFSPRPYETGGGK